jgi:hypothetical protein
MQRAARAKLGDLVRQEMEAEAERRRSGQQPSAGTTPTTGGDTNGRSSSTHTDTMLETGIAGASLADGGSGDRSARAAPGSAASSAPSAASTGSVMGTIPTQPGTAATAAAAVPASTASETVAAARPPPAGDQPGPVDDDNGWHAAQQDWAEEWQRVKDRWQQFVERPLDPPPLPSQDALGAAGKDEDPTEGGELRRQAAVSRLVQLGCVAVFIAQWAPVVQAVLAAPAAVAAATGGPPGRDVLLALLLASPPTPMTLAWQAVGRGCGGGPPVRATRAPYGDLPYGDLPAPAARRS